MVDQISYKVSPVPFTAVTVEDDFWSHRLETNRRVTIPYDFKKCEETGRIDNFAKAGGLLPGEHEGIFYNDSDVFKVIEGAAYSLSLRPDPELDRYLDDLIVKIAAAQEADGYLYTARTIDPENVSAEREGLTRWSNLRVSHELYNVGHLYEAAVAHFQATGKRSLLEVALKNANLIERTFGPDKKRDVPGHQEIEIGLVKLYHVTGDEKFLNLARFFLEERGQARGRTLYENHGHAGYMQDHRPVVDQSEAVGHAVRAGYMVAAMADVAALTGDAAYGAALDRIWENVVGKKLYITGGIGALHRGEAFGQDYELPNETAYAETCAAIANAMWNHRMFLLHGQARYIDILERVIYNGFLSGIALSGDAFFYPNPLASDGRTPFNRNESATRNPWFDCSCCPTNIVRSLPSLLGYIYAQRQNDLYVNLFISGRGTVDLPHGRVQVRQASRYPWEGAITITVEPERPLEFGLRVRIPGWAQNRPVPSDLYRYRRDQPQAVILRVNGDPIALEIDQGFARIHRTWQPGDRVELSLPMPVRRVLSHKAVAANAGRVALERGPLVYCAEGIDHGGSVGHLFLADKVELQPEHRPNLLDGVTVIQGRVTGLHLGQNGRSVERREQTLVAIPYYAWSHRGEGEMAVWLAREASAAQAK